MKQTILTAALIIISLSNYAGTFQNQEDTIAFFVKAYDGLDLPAQIIHPASGASDKIIVFINGSTPYDEKGNMGPMVDDKGKAILIQQEFYVRFQDIMPAKGYSTVSMAKRSLVEPVKIPRPTLDELALDIAFLIDELKNQKFLTPRKELYLVGYSEGSTVASKVLGLLKEQPRACIFLGSAASSFDYNKSWEEWPQTAIYRKLKKWSDEQLKVEYEQWKDIVVALQNMNEETFEKEYKKSNPHGFGFAQWESFHIDKEVSNYYPEANIIDANIPVLICIGENDAAMPEKRAAITYHNLLDKGFRKATYVVIPEEVHQYNKFDVFGIIDCWISSDFSSTHFETSTADQVLIDKYAGLQQLNSELNKLPYTGSLKAALDFYNKAKSNKMNDPGKWFTLGIKLVGNGFTEEAFDAFSISNREGDMIQSGSLVWLGHLSDLKGNREQAVKLYKKALQVYPGFPIQHSHWNIYLSREWIEERIDSPFTMELLKVE
ncbi:MAG: hypothetical protein HQ522_08895 [Bacteroidetes bacterium]|nr:hypothetical protein [Bacteroidota bacterium]